MTALLNITNSAQTLDRARQISYKLLEIFATSEDRHAKLIAAFGDRFKHDVAQDLIESWSQGNFKDIPAIELRRADEINGALGAFAKVTNKIYLSQEFLDRNATNPQIVADILLEEIGHYTDSQINVYETPGDEGAIFSALVQGRVLDEIQLQLLRAEDDSATILLDGQLITIEQATFPGTNSNDSLPSNGTGNGGDDIFVPLLGQDRVDGGAGNDVLIVDYSANSYGGSSSGISSYTPSFSNGIDAAAGFNGSLSAYKDNNYNSDSIIFSEIERFQITGTNFADTIFGGSGNDILKGGAGDDSITSGGGVDTIDGGAGLDTLEDGNFSNQTINLVINNSGATLSVGNGTTITGMERFKNLTIGSGNDSITFTTNYNETINTGAGNDTINSGNGNDIVDGGEGTDTLIVDYSANTFAGSSSYTPGINSSYYSNFDGGFQGNLSAYKDSAGAYDNISFSNIERFQITGTNFADTIEGGFSNDILKGGAGNDLVRSRGGVDNIDGGAGLDTLDDAEFAGQTTGIAIDNSGATLSISDGTAVTSIEQFNKLITGSGNDSITFNTIHDEEINTAGGDDTINSGFGHDTVDGGGGNDLLIVDYSANTFAGITYSNSTFSPLTYNGSGGFDGYLRAQTNNSGSYNSIDFKNIERFQITGTNYADTIKGGSGNDTLKGRGGFDLIISGGGIDTIDGGTGTDTLADADFSSQTTGMAINNSGTALSIANGTNITGVELFNKLITGSGNDSITFNTIHDEEINTAGGDDTINSGFGRDTVDGGGGNDLLIVDYSANTFAGITYSPNNLTYNGSGGFDGYLRAQTNNSGSYNSIDFKNIERFQITGTNYADRIIGGSGNDIFNGGTGEDLITSGGGIDTIDGGMGTDTLADADFSSQTTGMAINNSGATLSIANGTTITGVELFNRLITGSGNDSITFNTIHDEEINTDGGNDFINSGDGHDTVDGGRGIDTLAVDYSASAAAGYGIISFVYANGMGGFNGYYAAQIDSSGNNNIVNFSNIEKFQIAGTDYDDEMAGGAYDDVFSAGYGNDEITAGGGNDLLDGGEGSDSLDGGGGNDTYVVDSYDTIVESSTSPTEIDTVQASVSWDLSGTNLENLVLTGDDATNGIGNSLNNNLTGNSANNTLNGGDGNDTLNGGAGNDNFNGGAGNDTYIVDTYDTVVESSASPTETDTVQAGVSWTLDTNVENLTATGTGAINCTGNSSNNYLTGNSANNTLDGKTGADNLKGGAGNDTYIVDSTSDVVLENWLNGTDSGGNDTVQSAVSYSLGNFVENLTATGTSAINCTGNSSNNNLTGNSANNTLDGKTGADNLKGGAGNDTYIVDSTSDVVLENWLNGTDSGGNDTVQSAVSYTLGNFVENLTATGAGAINCTGNSSNNNLTGNSANNTLDGGANNDTLIGGAGNDSLIGGFGYDTIAGGSGTDSFIFSAADRQLDSISDFAVVDDTIVVSANGFGGSLTSGAAIASNQFALGTTATTANQRFLYDTSTGALFFDIDGTGSTAAVQIASISNRAALTSADIFVA